MHIYSDIIMRNKENTGTVEFCTMSWDTRVEKKHYDTAEMLFGSLLWTW